MMYRLLKDLINWKCNLYIKCKLGKFRYARVSSPVFLSLLLLVSLDLVHCSSLSNNVESGRGRTLYEHGIFRHDKPWDSISPPRSESDSTNDAAHHNSDYSPTISPPDNRDKYTYDRFKRSVTTLNFHPKPKNHSASGLKPLRIFKYVTEDDVLQPSGPSHSEAHHHQTVFRPFMKNESDHSGDINHSARVVGGAKVNLKVKLDKDDKKENSKKNKSTQVIRKSSDSPKKEANHQDDSTGNSESKSQPKIIPTPSRPENIFIFKPSLAIRKNKTSLIPSGKFAKSSANTHLNQMSNGVSNSITAAISTKPQQQQQEESTDPNSSTVNDRSLIHNYFDSVVVLNEEEGQKQLLRQGSYYREKTSNSDDVVDNGVGSGGDDDEEGDAIKNTMSEAHSPHPPTSSFSFTSVRSPNSNADTRGSRASVDEMKNLITAEKKISSPSSPIMRNSTNGSLVEIHRTKMNGTIGGNRDRVIVKVVKKGRKSRQRQEGLAEDDGAMDGSERSRRSPFKVHPRFQQKQQQNGNRHAQINAINKGGSEQLARAALFRRNTAIMMTPRMRQLNPAMTKKVAVGPRIITSGSSGPFARTIIPMKPIPVMQVVKKSVGPHRLTFMPSGGGPIGPGPVGPPLAAIKVMPLTQNKNIFIQQTPITNPSAPPLPITPTKDMMAGASKTVYNFRPFPEGLVLNQAASSYYSPTYRKFQKGFEDQISNIMDGGKELEDTANTWEESRPPRRHHRQHQPRPRSRSSARHRHHRNHRPRHHDHHRHTHHHSPSPHRSGAHSQHPHHRQPTARGKKLSNPKYTYPKNAESIQDILNYFEKDVPPQPRARHHDPPERSGPMSPKRQQSSLPASHDPPGPAPSYTKMADLSGEFRDVHASLLKDIKEFAKRPNMFSSSSDNYARQHHNHRKSNHRDSMEGSGFFFDPIDEIFNPQPKPVRDMIKQNHKNHDYDIKPDLYSLENIRERIALKRGKLGGRHNKDKDHSKDTHSFQFDPPHTDNEEDYYDAHRPSSKHTSEGGYSSGEHIRNFNSKEDYDMPSSFKKNPYDKDSGDDSHALFPNAQYKESSFSSAEWKSIQDAEFAAKSHITSSTRKPIVLKRPNESFRKEQRKKSDREHFWNSLGQSPTTLNLDSPLVLKSPQAPTVLHPFSYSSFQTHAAAAAAAAHAMKPVSEEEDIVEIHTGGPGMSSASGVPSYTTNSQHMKQERLKKMYMDVLQQKLQLEAALLQPQAMPSTLHHPGMQTSSSLLPQLQQHQLQQHQLQQHQLQQNQLQQHQLQQHQLQQQLQQHQLQQLPQLQQHQFQQLPQLQHHQQHQHSHLQLPQVSMAPQLSGYSPSTIVTHTPLTGMGGLVSPRRKKPMRMKIHIYPNGNEGMEQGIEAANLLAAGGFGTSGFSASNPPPSVVAPPHHEDMNKMSESAIPSGPTGPHPTSPSGYGGTAPMPQTVGSAVKNKNVVLHLHVHRRNDNSAPLELETEGSSPIAATVLPPKLTYKQIYDEQMKSEQHHNLQNHRMAAEEEEERSLLNSSPQEGQESQNHNHHHHHHHEQDEEEDVDVERDKSISMEAPIHDDKIENVFHTIMKLRKRPASDDGSTAEDNRTKRNRN